MGCAGALANIKAHADRDWWPGGKPSRCLMPVGCGTKHLGAAKYLALVLPSAWPWSIWLGGRLLHTTKSPPSKQEFRRLCIEFCGVPRSRLNTSSISHM